jgi:hypothetical protein
MGRPNPLIIVYVVVAFLAQAALGGALLQSGALATRIGWATILWNLAWLVALPIITPRDIYFPILHHAAPADRDRIALECSVTVRRIAAERTMLSPGSLPTRRA